MEQATSIEAAFFVDCRNPLRGLLPAPVLVFRLADSRHCGACVQPGATVGTARAAARDTLHLGHDLDFRGPLSGHTADRAG